MGYSGTEVAANQFYMVGVQFADVASANETADFNSYITTTCTPGEYGDGEDGTMGGAPQIQVLNANGRTYTLYYFISDAYNTDDTPHDGACWADAGGYVVTEVDAQSLSKGFWFKSITDGTITCAGQVTARSEFSRAVPSGQFEIVANPYPVALDLNTPASTGFTPGEYGDGEDGTMGNAPQVQVLNANGRTYALYYYISDAYNLDDTPHDGACWADAGGYIAEGTQVGVGQAFWIKSATAGTFTFAL